MWKNAKIPSKLEGGEVNYLCKCNRTCAEKYMIMGEVYYSYLDLFTLIFMLQYIVSVTSDKYTLLLIISMY